MYIIFLPSPPDATIAPLLKGLTQVHDIANAGITVHPQLLRELAPIAATLQQLNKAAEQQGRPMLVLILNDDENKYPSYEHLLLLRTSLRRSLKRSNEYVMPYLWESRHEPFSPSSISEKPLVGFCGLVSEHRRQLITAFENDSRFQCSFIGRDEFWGGKPHDPELMQEFWQNMEENNFVLANRGTGNFSMRFYQALSLGRIPVLVDMDMELPLAHLIPWKDIIVFENSEIACIQRVWEIFEHGQVQAMQQQCYDYYHHYLSQENFMKYFLQKVEQDLIKEKKPWWKRWSHRIA